jgi:uncharacterized protein (TIGR02147 family)
MLVDGFDLVARWYFPAIVVCLDGCATQTASKVIAEKTGIDLKQIESVIALLKQRDLLLEENGSYKVEFAHFVSHDKKGSSEASKSFLREQLNISLSTLEKNYANGPKFFSHTFTIAKSEYSNYVDSMKAFVEELSARSNEESPDEVIQLNIQIFRLLDRA